VVAAGSVIDNLEPRRTRDWWPRRALWLTLSRGGQGSGGRSGQNVQTGGSYYPHGPIQQSHSWWEDHGIYHNPRLTGEIEGAAAAEGEAAAEGATAATAGMTVETVRTAATAETGNDQWGNPYILIAGCKISSSTFHPIFL